MKYTSNYGYKQPERTVANDDPADINDLADNWGKLDGDLDKMEKAADKTAESLATHMANRANPHGVTAGQIGAATIEEVEQRVAVYEEHVEDKDNPHDTTAAQVGAYSTEEMNELLDGKVTQIGVLGSSLVLVSDEEGEGALTSTISTEDLEALSGITGNIQAQLNNISFYNYLSPAPLITLSTGGDDFPEQDIIDGEVIPVIEALYPAPEAHDAVIQNVQTQNTTQRAAFLYSYFDGSQSDGFIGWRYVTQIDTLINLADGSVNGVVRSSDDINFIRGQGTVNHATKADLAEAANGLVTIDLPSGADLHTYYDVDHNAVYVAGPGNTVANKPAGVDGFVMLSQRAAAGHTIHVLYAVNAGDEFSSIWTEEWNGTAWSKWKSPIGDIAKSIEPIGVSDFNTNPNTWGFPDVSGDGTPYKPGTQWPVYGPAGATGLPSGFGMCSGVFIRTDSVGSGTLMLTKQVMTELGTGATTEIIWRSFITRGIGNPAWATWRAIGKSVGSDVYPFDNGYFNALTLNGDTITEWPEGGGAGGKKYATVVIGTTTSGHTSEDVDYLCNGTNDVSVFKNVFNTLGKQAGGKVHILEGNYVFNDNLDLLNLKNLLIEGEGIATKFTLSKDVQVVINDCSDIIFKDVLFYCVEFMFLNNAIVHTQSSNNIKFLNASISSYYTIALHLQSSTGLVVQSCNITSLSNSAIRAQGSNSGTVIQGCKLDGNSRTGGTISMLSNTYSVNLLGNIILAGGAYGVRIQSGCQNFNILNNVFIGSTTIGILIDRASYFNVIGNSLRDLNVSQDYISITGTSTDYTIEANGMPNTSSQSSLERVMVEIASTGWTTSGTLDQKTISLSFSGNSDLINFDLNTVTIDLFTTTNGTTWRGVIQDKSASTVISGAPPIIGRWDKSDGESLSRVMSTTMYKHTNVSVTGIRALVTGNKT